MVRPQKDSHTTDKIGGITMRYCGKCGATVSDTAVFCAECGSRLSSVGAEYGMGKQTLRSQQLNTHRNKDSITIIVAIIAGIIVLTILAIFVYVTVFRQSVPKEMESPIVSENAGSVTVPIKDTDNQLVIEPEPTVEPIEQAYVKAFEQFLPIEAVLPRDLHYGMYDIDKNGIPELIIEDYYNATESIYHIYTYNSSGISYVGNYPGVHSSLYEYNGSGLVYFSAMNGTGVIRLFSIDNGALSVVRSINVNPQNYYEPGDVFEGAESRIVLHSYYNTQDSYKDIIYSDLNLSSKMKIDFLEEDIENYIVSFVRPLYIEINNNLSQYSVSTSDGITYWHDGNGCIKQSLQAGTNNYSMAREYYYNTDSGQIVFALVWQDNIEHRLYFRANQLIRYIGPDGNIINNPESEQALNMERHILSEAY